MRRREADESVIADNFVVSVLNDILSDIAPEPSGVLVPPPPDASMAGRLGQVLSWAANLIALAVLATFLVIASEETNNAGVPVLIGVVIAAVIWLAGRGLRYVLAGS
jgi:hypothetical protein